MLITLPKARECSCDLGRSMENDSTCICAHLSEVCRNAKSLSVPTNNLLMSSCATIGSAASARVLGRTRSHRQSSSADRARFFEPLTGAAAAPWRELRRQTWQKWTSRDARFGVPGASARRAAHRSLPRTSVWYHLAPHSPHTRPHRLPPPPRWRASASTARSCVVWSGSGVTGDL